MYPNALTIFGRNVLICALLVGVTLALSKTLHDKFLVVKAGDHFDLCNMFIMNANICLSSPAVCLCITVAAERSHTDVNGLSDMSLPCLS